MEMIFKELFIFSPREKRARKITLERGVNIITSSKIDGANRGKSIVVRSLYHTLGAEAFFESNFDAKNKVFVLHFEVDSSEYYMFRAADLFKVFDAKKRLLFVSTSTHDLSCQLRNITGFGVELPNRDKNELEITPPVYNYLPFYLDQDHYCGSQFESFKNLRQYKDFKETVLLCHFGVFSTDYFGLVRDREQADLKKTELENRLKVLGEILKDVDGKLDGKGYSKDLQALERDVALHQKTYSETVRRLAESRNHLVAWRNELFDLEETIGGLVSLDQENESAIKSLHDHHCPECGSFLKMPISLKSRRYNLADDIVGLKTDMQKAMVNIKAKIADEEHHYAELLEILRQYERSMKLNAAEINDILRFKGLCEVRNDVAEDLRATRDNLESVLSVLSELAKKIKEVSKRKKSIENRYYETLVQAKSRFGLDEIDAEQFKSLKRSFTASGSDRCIATIIWHCAIIQLRSEFNPSAIKFPVVFDSPNNVETDDEKTEALIQYLFENANLSGQFIISGIGFDTDEFKNKMEGPMNVIVLKNAQYHLLCEEDYLNCRELLDDFCNAGLMQCIESADTTTT